ncbi:MAG: hypothetical protein RLZZ450_6899 [Pseudomonadota bacterium]|jgi:hypothetical protein
MPNRFSPETVTKRSTITVQMADNARAAIDEKWRALGGAPGAPVVPNDGLVKIGPLSYYRDFADGRIYSGDDTFWVHGLIFARYMELGGPGSWLGYPRSDEFDFDGGKVSVFERGSIYWWPDIGTRELNDVIVHYTGLHAFGETDVDHGSDDDEPYATLGVASPDDSARTFRTQIYQDVDGGEGRFDVIELYRGKPRGLTISTLLNEHSGGDTGLSRRAMDEAINRAGPALAAAATMIPVVGPVLGPLASAAFEHWKDDLINALNSFVEHSLGFADRPLGADVLTLTPREMVLLATRPEGHAQFNEIPWRFETHLMSRFGASYKVYFNIFGV